MSSNDQSDDTVDKTIVRQESTVKTQVSRWDSAASIVIWLPAGRRGEQFIIDGNVVIGRSKGCDIHIDDSGMSKRHAQFSIEGEKVRIIDLNSTNGTFLDREKIAPKVPLEINANCFIRMGSTVFMYYKPGSVEASKVSAVFKQAYMDPLTGILNKRALMEKGGDLLEKVEITQKPLSLLMFDIDHFKLINDKHPGGHLAGDYVLKELSALIQNQIIRVEDLFARFGGEEFIVMLHGASRDKAIEVGERIRQEVQSYKFSHSGTPMEVTVSIGVANYTDKESLDSLIQRADKALYKAKNGGRNRVECD